MKKHIFILVLTSGLSSAAMAQSYWNGSTTVQTTTSGKVGIGTTTPTAKLEVKSSSTNATGPALLVSQSNGYLTPGGTTYPNTFEVKNSWAGFPVDPTYLDLWVTGNGLVGIRKALRIGATASSGSYANYALSVDGDIIAKRCVIQVDNWADYVFAHDYQLPSLNEVASFVAENKHLPGVPSEAEIKEKGVDMGEMNKILMQKVEELTLYIIDLKKEVDQLKAKK